LNARHLTELGKLARGLDYAMSKSQGRDWGRSRIIA
jgi:hypothetical protein